MDLCDIREVRSLLDRHGFRFSKSMGQNFLIAGWVPQDIAAAGGGDRSCGVLGSSSTDTTFPARWHSSRVRHPIPGPISSTQSSFVICAASTIFARILPSIRKFCPYFFCIRN